MATPIKMNMGINRKGIILRRFAVVERLTGTGVGAPETTIVGSYEKRGAIGAPDFLNQESYFQASPSAVGTLSYIAFETRRLHEAMKPKGEKFVPLEVTSLVRPLNSAVRFFTGATESNESLAHSSGHVFDIDYASLPPGEQEALPPQIHHAMKKI